VTTVAVVGSGPAAEAARTALSDLSISISSPDVAGIADADLAIVVGLAGSPGFERANANAVNADQPWLAVEVGGVGGRPTEDVAAAVSAFGRDAGCFDCLRTRVEAAADEEPVAEPSANRSDVRLAGAIAGRRAVGALGGESVAGTVVEVPYAERRFLPVPGCEQCAARSERSFSLDRDYRDVPLDEAVARAERAVDDRVGVVTGVGERESFPAAYYLAALCDTSGFSDAKAPGHAAGVAEDWNHAYVKALGESLERYAAGVYREREFTVAPAADMANPVPPGEFVCPDSFRPPDAGESLPWLPAEHLASREQAHLPAEFVVFPPPDERFKPSITTGLGLGNSTVEALRSGLYEVVERDATMLAWYSTFEPLGLSVEHDRFDALARHARAENLAVTPLLVTQDVDVPVVAVAVHREDGWPAFALGSAADLDADAAATAALAEALQNWMELRAMGPEQASEEDGAIGRYAEFPREVQGLVEPDVTVDAAEVGPADPPSGAAELDAVVSRLADAGIDAYAARLTPRDVERLGFEAVRVLAPSAQPLFTGDAYFGERARDVPRELGYRPRLDRPYHPYP
jgi:ribosomal protein S12 methylthiotransferase accessory factor